MVNQKGKCGGIKKGGNAKLKDARGRHAKVGIKNDNKKKQDERDLDFYW